MRCLVVFAAAALPCACLNVSVGYLGSLSSVAPDAVESFALFQLAVADAGALSNATVRAEVYACDDARACAWRGAAALAARGVAGVVSGLPSAALAPAAVALGAAGVPLLAVASVDASLAAKGDMPTLLRSGDVETRAIDVLAAVVASRNWTVAGAVAPRTDAGFARSVALQGALDARNVTLRVVADFAVEPDGAGDPSSVALALDVLALSGCRVAILLGDAASTPAVVDAAGAAGVLDSVAWLAIDGAMPDGWKRGGGRTFEGWLVATPVSYRSSDAAKKLRRSFDDAATAWDCEAYNSSQLYDGTIWDVADADDGSLACAGDGGASRAGSLAYDAVGLVVAGAAACAAAEACDAADGRAVARTIAAGTWAFAASGPVKFDDRRDRVVATETVNLQRGEAVVVFDEDLRPVADVRFVAPGVGATDGTAVDAAACRFSSDGSRPKATPAELAAGFDVPLVVELANAFGEAPAASFDLAVAAHAPGDRGAFFDAVFPVPARATNASFAVTTFRSGAFKVAATIDGALVGGGRLDVSVLRECVAGERVDDQGQCATCDQGTYSATSDAPACLVCGAGSYATVLNDSSLEAGYGVCGGADGCAACPAGHYNPDPYQSTCLACSREHHRLSHPGAVACGLCEAGYLDARGDADPGSDAECAACGSGLECGVPGLNLATVAVTSGYWRATMDTHETQKCRGGRCAGGPGAGDDLCEAGSTGPVCDVCDGGYTYSAAADRCLSCAGNKAPNWLFAAAAFVAFLAAFAFVVVRRDEGSEADDAARNRLRLAFKLRSKWRILFVALQILTMYPAILSSVRYPKVYTELIGPFRVLGLDVPALLPLSCLTAGTFDYFASLRFMTLGPLLLVVGSCVEIKQ